MAEFTENQMYQALGIEPEKPAVPGRGTPDPYGGGAAHDSAEGGQAQEPAAPAPEGAELPTEGEKEQESADPVDGSEAPGRENRDEHTVQKDEEEPEEPGGEKPAMTPEERRKAAQERRRREQQAAVDEAVEKAIQAEREKSRAEMTNFFKGAKLKNTITGELITSMEEYRAWQEAFEAEKLRRDLAAGKLTPEGLDKAIAGSEAMRRVREIVQRDDEAKRQQDMAAAQAKAEADMVEIRKLDPTIQTIQDLLKMPTSKEFFGYVTKNRLSFLQAFKLANQDRITAQRQEAARQQALNAARGKSHLSPIGAGKGKGADAIPSEDVAYFRAIMPEATEAEVRAYIEKYNEGRRSGL